MQRGDYPMFIFASHRKPLASDDLVRSADLSESLLESTGPEPEPEVPQNSVASVSAISRSPPPEEYVVLWPMLLWRVGKGVFKKFQKMVMHENLREVSVHWQKLCRSIKCEVWCQHCCRTPMWRDLGCSSIKPENGNKIVHVIFLIKLEQRNHNREEGLGTRSN